MILYISHNQLCLDFVTLFPLKKNKSESCDSKLKYFNGLLLSRESSFKVIGITVMKNHVQSNITLVIFLNYTSGILCKAIARARFSPTRRPCTKNMRNTENKHTDKRAVHF